MQAQTCAPPLRSHLAFKRFKTSCIFPCLDVTLKHDQATLQIMVSMPGGNNQYCQPLASRAAGGCAAAGDVAHFQSWAEVSHFQLLLQARQNQAIRQ